MKKYTFLLVLLISTILLYSCTIGVGRMFFDDTDQRMDNRLQEILEAIQSENQEALKSMFSKQALGEAKNFEENTEYLFAFFQGNVISWERERLMSQETVRYGKKVVIPIVWYIVVTDVKTYKFFIIDYTINTIHRDGVGLYTLRVIEAEDEETEFASWQKMEVPGIYKPE